MNIEMLLVLIQVTCQTDAMEELKLIGTPFTPHSAPLPVSILSHRPLGCPALWLEPCLGLRVL